MAKGDDNPYVGPRTFEEKDSRFFFGREREARDLLSLVISEPLVLFYAESGAGKSSLINTRLVPGLRTEGFAVLPIGRVGGALPADVESVDNVFVFNLLLSLDQERNKAGDLRHVSLTSYLQAHKESLLVSPAADDEEDGSQPAAHVLIIDQFEEIITTNLERWPEREVFFRQLSRAIKDDPWLWVVLSLREDYMAALSPYARLLPGKLRARCYMQRMAVAAALEAVEKPARQSGRSFAPGVAQALVDNLRQLRSQTPNGAHLGQFVEPVQLQVVCYQLWQNLADRPQTEITQQDLEELGNVDTALAQFYEQAIASVWRQTGASEIELRNWFERKLITEAETRGTVYQGMDETAGLDNRVVHLLANQFLLRREIRAGGAWYELVHDRFVTPILQANQGWRLRQSPLVQAAEAWDRAGRPTAKLYQDNQLKEALAVVNRATAERLVQEFLMAGEDAQSQRDLATAQVKAAEQAQRAAAEARAAQRLRRLSRILFLAILFAIGATVWALVQSENAGNNQIRAESEATRAVEQRVIANAASTRAVEQQGTADAASTVASGQQAQAEEASTRAISQQKTAVAEATRAIEQQEAAVAAATQALVQRATAEYASTQAIEQQGTAEAIRAEAITEGSLLLAQSLAFSALDVSSQGGDDELALLLALEADHINRREGGNLHDIIDPALLPGLTKEYFSVVLRGHDGPVNAIAYSPNGRLLASAGGDGTVRLWQLDEQAAPATLLVEQEESVNAVLFTPDGQRLISGGDDGVIRLWSVADLAAPSMTLAEAGPIRAMAISTDGSQLATSLASGTVNLWTLTDAEPSPSLVSQWPEPAVQPTVFDILDTTITVGNPDGVLQSWALHNLFTIFEEFPWLPAPISYVTAYGDGNAFAAVTGAIRVQRLQGGFSVDLVGHSSAVNSLSISASGTTVASAGSDGAVRIWDLPAEPEATTASARAVLTEHLGSVLAVAFSPDDRWLASAGSDGAIRLWRLMAPTNPLPNTGTALSFAPDGQMLASAINDDFSSAIHLQPADDLLAEPVILAESTDLITSLAFSLDGRMLAAGNSSRTTGSVRLSQIDQSPPSSNIFRWLTYEVRAVAFSPPESRWLAAAGSANGDITLYEPDNPAAQPITLSGHTTSVVALAFAPDGQWLLSATSPAGRDHTVRLWSLADLGSAVPSSSVLSEQGANALTVSADGEMLAAAGGLESGSIYLWLVDDLDAGPHLLSGPAAFTRLAISPDGRTLAATADGIYLWRLDNPTNRPIILPAEGALTSLAFSPDGRSLLVSGEDGTHLWPSLESLPEAACQQVRRNITRQEWQQYVVTEPYRATCPNLPGDAGAAQASEWRLEVGEWFAMAAANLQALLSTLLD